MRPSPPSPVAPRRPIPLRLVLLCVSLATVGCQPDLDDRASRPVGGGDGGGGGSAVRFTIEPDVSPDEVPPALRVRVEGAVGIDPTRVHLAKGRLGPGHLRQLEEQQPSQALEDRLLDALVWAEGDAVVLAPVAALEVGETYAVGVAQRRAMVELTVVAPSDATWLARVWPPSDAPLSGASAVYCAERALSDFAADVPMAPSGHSAVLARGAMHSGAGHRCAHLVLGAPAPVGARLLPPPRVELGSQSLALDPAPLEVAVAAAPGGPSLGCEPDEAHLGPGCVRVEDDRATVRTPDADLLWAATGPNLDLVALTKPSEPLVLHPLLPEHDNVVLVGVLDRAGRETTIEALLRTGTVRPHVVINEVLADCLGPEPAGEWVEIVNDGAVEARLGGMRLLDVGGDVELPDVVLPAGEFALLVGEAYAPDPAYDPVPPPGARLLRVPRLGRGGLANGGELLRLVDAGGRVLSAVPPIPSEEPGMSTARRQPSLADAPSSFTAATPTPAAPNGLPLEGPLRPPSE